MTIGKRLYLNFGLILAILLGLFGANTWSLLREQSAKAEAVRSLEVARAMEAVRFQMMQNRMALQNYLLSGDTREVTRMNSGASTLGELLKKAEGNALSDVQRNALIKVERSEQDWTANFAGRMIEKRKEVDAGNATVADLQVAYLTMEPETWVAKSTEPLDDAQAETTRLLAERQRSDDSATRWTMIISVLCTMIALGLGVAIALRTSKSITDPLAHLIGVAREIGDSGDLNHKIDIQRQDEVGELGRTFANMVNYLKEMAVTSERIAGGDLGVDITPRSERDTLAHAFSKMTESLRSTVSTVRDSAAQVAAGSNQVADASDESAKISVKASSAIDEVTSTMHEMTINVQNMVRNTQTQASSVSETSASIDEMVASIQRVADTAKVLLDISNRSREEVQNGINTMQKATEGLNRINESIGSSAGIIAELGARADDIGKIIEVIDDISEQTNLLALNAAIEAARAGEHGLGFAVVADEVRKLAEKSAQSTKEISELIQSIQKEARKAVDDMSRSTSIVNDGLSLGSDLSNALRKISSVVTEVYKFAQEIGAATNEQSHGSSQIAKATTRLNEITHEITSSVEEQAGGAQAVVRAMERMRELIQQTTSGSTELAASAEQMSKMSRSLLEAMDVFVLNGHNGNGNGRKAFSFENPEMPREGASRYAATARS